MREAVARPADTGVLGWLKARERKILLATVVAQLAILLGMIALRAAPLVTGQTVLVRVAPVDPRDLFRGDYVILSYDFSQTPREKIEGLSNSERGSWNKSEGRPVYVPLVPDSIPNSIVPYRFMWPLRKRPVSGFTTVAFPARMCTPFESGTSGT